MPKSGQVLEEIKDEKVTMKDKKAQASVLLIVVLLGVMLAIGGLVFVVYKISGTKQEALSPSGLPVSVVQVNGCPQNPALTLILKDILTGQSIAGSIANYKDKATGNLLSAAPAFSLDQTVIPMANATGYLTAIQKEHTVTCNNQNVYASLKQQANVTITIWADSGISVIGGNMGTLGNDTTFTTSHNNKIRLVGTAYRSTGRLMAIYEVGTNTNVSTATLSGPIGYSITPVTVPNCYTANITDRTTFKAAWELAPLDNGAVVDLNLQTTAANGNAVSNRSILTIYSEQDGVDSLTGDYLTSGICDSNNRYIGFNGAFGAGGAPTTASIPIGQKNMWFFGN